MKVNRKYKPELVASKDACREVLQQLNVCKTHAGMAGARIVSSDGRMAVWVPVELDDGDTEGMMRADVLKVATQFTPKKRVRINRRWRKRLPECVSVEAHGLYLDVAHGNATMKRVTVEGLGEKYANTESLITSMMLPRSAIDGITLNPRMLLDLAKAMGVPDGLVRLEFRGRNEPIVVRPNDDTPTDASNASAVGMIMPGR